MRAARSAALAVAIAVVAVAAWWFALPNSQTEPSGTVTFNKDIAPIIYANCSVCHRPGGPGPFSLLTYDDVKSRASLIAEVTGIRLMPPWLPEPGTATFAGDRRLTAQQIDAIG